MLSHFQNIQELFVNNPYDKYVKSFICTIWDDVRTYLTTQIDPIERSALIAAISHFKKKEGRE